MKRTATLLLGLTLAVPALAIDTPQPATIHSIETIPGTVVRIGQGINAAYRVTAATGLITEIWMYTDCRTDDKTMLFVDAQTGKALRVYSTDSIDRYAPGMPFEAAADSPFMSTPGLDLCKQKVPEAKWAGLPSASQNGEKRFVDVNNSKRDGAMLKARLATDFDKISRDEKYGAPFSLKIEDVVLNCENAQGKTVRTFSLDNQGRVTDTSTPGNSTFTALTAEKASLAKTLCAVSNLSNYKGTGTLVWRSKEMDDATPAQPDLEHNTPEALQRFPFPTNITSAIGKLFADPQQKPAFRSVSYTQNSAKKDGFGVGMAVKVDAQPDGTTLTIVQSNIGNVVFYSQYQRLFNMVDLKKWETLSQAPWVSKTLENNIMLPLKPGKIYSSRGEVTNRDKPGTEKTLSQTCVAGKEWHNAADIHPSFPGRYLELICKEDLGDGRNASSDYAYFEDLRLFIRIGYQDEGGVQRFTYSDVTVVR